jgi:iron complex outermembrane receptor protein
MYFRLSLVFCFFVWAISAPAQFCDIQLSGSVLDSDTRAPLEGVNVFIQEASTGTTTDSAGKFRIPNLCIGSYHIIFSHIGCESQQIFLDIRRDTTLNMRMEHSQHELEGIVVTGSNIRESAQNSQTIGHQSISDNANQNLSNLLESISGVSTLRNGSGIAKPVVHGLYGNRLTLLNNGIVQSGQQWGNDHSPEIDPLVANKIRVIKGVSSIEYAGSNLGSVILVEPSKIKREPHLHGDWNYFYETNGRGHGTHLQMQKYDPNNSWKASATWKNSGDRKTSDYFLNNTGSREANLAVQLEKSLSERHFSDLYFSSFNSSLGILRGAHIGNLTDLGEAFERQIPFFTEEKFSREIDPPKQRINHHLLKLHHSYFLNDDNKIEFSIAGQYNNREEFDVRRSGRSEVPALSLRQYSLFTEGKYNALLKSDVRLKTGVQINLIDNTNRSETGLLPLIPDYSALESGLFLLASKEMGNSFVEFGLRYDNLIRKVVTITNTAIRTIVRYENKFHNFSGNAGITHDLSDNVKMGLNMGVASRYPAINELYSGGLHQGVSGIEEGNPDLKSEKSFKTTYSLLATSGERFTFEALLYYQKINEYVFLNPQNETRLTIRGSFPVFKYDQTDADISGADLSAHLKFSNHLSARIVYSYIKGNDKRNDVSLINIPSNTLQLNLRYAISKPIHIGTMKFENLEFGIHSKHVFRQNDILPNQDFVIPPDGYQLIGLRAASNVYLNKTRFRLTMSVDNLWNTEYRDYLNRQRYFADDLGRSISMGLTWFF